MIPTREELLTLAKCWEERGDPRAEVARDISDPNSVRALLSLLKRDDRDEAGRIFLDRTMMFRRRYYDPQPESKWAEIRWRLALRETEAARMSLMASQEAGWLAKRDAEEGREAEAEHAGVLAEREWQADWIMKRAWGGKRPAT